MTDIIVVGGGPAGLTAALYARRAGKSVKVFEKENFGGQIVFSPMVDNYPAAPHISGAEFAERLQAQVEDLGAELCYEEVLAIEPKDGIFLVKSSGGLHEASAVVIATGVSHRKLSLPGEDLLVGGISYCAVCDGAFYAGKDVAVVGGGDTALQDALFLANTCRRVYLVHRRDQFRAEASLVSRALGCGNIEAVLNSVPEEYMSDNGDLSGLKVKDKMTGISRVLSVDGVFLAIGQLPQNDFVKELVASTPEGYLYSDETALTGVPGIFAAGDCRTKEVRQLTTAVGDGAVAGLAAVNYVDGK